jgi:hypothetical protein
VVENFRRRYTLQILTVELQTANVAYLKKKNPIIRIVYISGRLAVPINPDKMSSTVYFLNVLSIIDKVLL